CSVVAASLSSEEFPQPLFVNEGLEPAETSSLKKGNRRICVGRLDFQIISRPCGSREKTLDPIDATRSCSTPIPPPDCRGRPACEGGFRRCRSIFPSNSFCARGARRLILPRNERKTRSFRLRFCPLRCPV